MQISQKDYDAIVASGQVFERIPFDPHVFDMETDYDAIKKELCAFPVLRRIIDECGITMRILRQPFVKCLISFIISANNNIKRFSKTIAQIDFDNLDKYTEQDFVKMGCGYRAPYLVATIRRLCGADFAKFDELTKMSNETLRKTLVKLDGVGPKVADCVMLFAFHRLDVAPVDTHIRRAIDRLGKTQAAEIFSHRYAGVAQQYIFYYVQHLKKELK